MNNNYLENIRILNEASQMDRLVIFVGAGVSANSGYPTWKELIDKFAKGLNIKTDFYSTDDYLKIPQMYFNEYKNVEYFKIINEAFSIDAQPNEIHDLIFKLNPSHIITTNFDNLLEKKAAYSYGLYDLIKQDSDISHAQKTKSIIKMHGDLDLRNIVLKEDDYLEYSIKFPLIETYIKSLIATKTVLFVGYSVNDYNFKLIMQWVKSILKNDFRLTYLIYCDELPGDSRCFEIQYYKNRGINLIFTDEKPDIENISIKDDRGIQLYHILKEIAEYQIHYEDILDELYANIKNITFFNYLRQNDLYTLLDIGEIYPLGDKNILTHNSDKLNSFIAELRTHYDKDLLETKKHPKELIIKRILSFFLKIGIIGFQRIDTSEFFLIDDLNLKIEIETNTFFIANEFHLFNYKGAYQHFFKGKKDLRNDDETAYLYYAYNRFTECLNMLEKLFQDNKRHVIQKVMAFFNYKNVSGLSFSNKKKRHEITEKINTEEIIYNSPLLQKEKRFLIKLSDFNFYFIEFYNSLTEIKRLKNTIKHRTFSTNDPFESAEIALKEFYLFTIKNFLMVDKYNNYEEFYSNYIEVFFESYISDLYRSSYTIIGLEEDPKSFKVQNFSYFMVFIMIRYLRNENLARLLSDFKLKDLRFSNESERKEFFDAYRNLVNSINYEQIKEIKNDLLSYYINFILIFSVLKISENEYAEIIDNFIQISNDFYIYGLYSNFNSLLYAQKAIFSNEPSEATLQRIMNEHLFNEQKRKNIHDDLSFRTTIVNCARFLKERNTIYVIDDIQLSHLLKQFEKNPEVRMLRILIELSNIVQPDYSQRIKTTIQSTIEKKFDYQFYLMSVLSNVIEKNDHMENKLIEKANQILSHPNKIDLSGKSNQLKINIIWYITFTTINKEDFRELVGKVNPVFDYLILDDTIHLAEFKIKELADFGDKLISKLISNEVIFSLFKTKFKEFLMNPKNRNERLLEIYFKYFDKQI